MKGRSRRTLFLVSCVSKKRSAACAAKRLYVSPWFSKARAYVESRRLPWFILSAKHGLVRPEQRLAPYEMTLHRMKAAERRVWARRVLRRLQAHSRGCDRVVMLAGKKYREFLVPGLRKTGVRVEVPMARMSIGKQIQWLGRIPLVP